MSPKGGSDWGFLSYLRGLNKSVTKWNVKTVTTVGTVSFLVVFFKDRFSFFPFKTFQAETAVTAVTAEKVPLDLLDLRENRVPQGFLEYPVHQECRESQVPQDAKVRYDKILLENDFCNSCQISGTCCTWILNPVLTSFIIRKLCLNKHRNNWASELQRINNVSKTFTYGTWTLQCTAGIVLTATSWLVGFTFLRNSLLPETTSDSHHVIDYKYQIESLIRFSPLLSIWFNFSFSCSVSRFIKGHLDPLV